MPQDPPLDTDGLQISLRFARDAVAGRKQMIITHSRFLLIGYAGNAAPDHVDQLHALPEFLTWFR